MLLLVQSLKAMKSLRKYISQLHYYGITCLCREISLNWKWKSQNFQDYCKFTIQSGELLILPVGQANLSSEPSNMSLYLHIPVKISKHLNFLTSLCDNGPIILKRCQ
ncbi:hypothetical protein V6Z11_D12G034300 [Gossypium hirsutum]